MNKMILAALLTPLVLTGCAPLLTAASTKQSWRVEGKNLYFSGAIEPDTYARLAVVLNDSITDVYLSSSGGNLRSGYKIAELLKARNVNIHIIGPCISACPIVLAVGKVKTVAPGAYLGYHWNLTSSAEEQKADAIKAGTYDPIGDPEIYKDHIDKEVVFNRETGIQQALYSDAFAFKSEYQREIDPERKLSNDQFIWLPTPKELECYGLKVDQFWYPANGDLSKIGFGSKLTAKLFTTKTLKTIPAGVSPCIGL